jgi:hypothetical protein
VRVLRQAWAVLCAVWEVLVHTEAGNVLIALAVGVWVVLALLRF